MKKHWRYEGLKRSSPPWQQRNAAHRIAAGETAADVAREMNVHVRTVWNWCIQISEVDDALSSKRPAAFDWRLR